MIAMVDSGDANKGKVAVDLGPADQLNQLNLTKGSKISFRGRR